MNKTESIYFGGRLSLEMHNKLQVLAEYHKRSMQKQIQAMIEADYNEMKRNLSD